MCNISFTRSFNIIILEYGYWRAEKYLSANKKTMMQAHGI
jgi:hypothetical protein